MGAGLAITAAFAFALGSVLQQRGTMATTAAERDPRFLAEILRTPVWIFGAACQAVGWVLQAVALGHGSLVLVQALCALSLVIALPLGAWLTDQTVDGRTVVGALLVLGGIVAFVAIGQPEEGSAEPAASAWIASAIGSVLLIVVLGRQALRRGGAVAAALYAALAGVCFAYQGTVTKVFVDQLGGGLAGVLTTWTTYALIATAFGGFALQQSALRTGFLAPALAASNASTLVVSVVFGVWILGESVATGSSRLVAWAALAVSAIGIVRLSTAAPGPPRETAVAP